RLKEHIGRNDGTLICIGTSATVKGEDTAAAARFATELFGETFLPERVQTEQYQPLPEPAGMYLPPTPEIAEDDVRALRDLSDLDRVYDFCLDYVAPDNLVIQTMDAVRGAADAPAEFLGRVLAPNALFRAIESALEHPRSLDDVTRL